MDSSSRKIAELTNKLARMEKIDAPALSELQTQRRLLAVEAAGVKARIDACHQILAKTSNPDPVEQIKTTAEIELVGLSARMRALQDFIEQGKEYTQMSTERDREQMTLGKVHSRSTVGAAELTRSWAELYEFFAPLTVKDNTVTIQPIKWIPKAN